MTDIHNILLKGQTPLLVFSNILFLLFLFFFLKSALSSGYTSEKKVKKTYFLIFIFCLFSFWGTDWFGYLYYYQLMIEGGVEHIPMEDIYILLMDILPSYLLFRTVVWGGAILLLAKTISNLQLNKGLFLFFFCAISLIWFSYTRATLAMSFLYCGLSYLIKAQRGYGNKLIYYLIGVALIIISFFFHKSAAIGIVAIVIAILVHRIGPKKGLILFFVAYPFLIIAIRSVFPEFVNELIADETSMFNEYAVAGSSHLENKNSIQGLGIILQHFFERLPLYLMIYISYIVLKNGFRLQKGIDLIMITLCSMVLVASIFAFDLGMNTQTLYVRMMRYAQIPLCICLTYLYEHKLCPALTKWTYTLGIISCAYTTSYMLYNIIVG